MTAAQVATLIINELKAIREEYRASGAELSMRTINYAIIRIARRLKGRTDAGRHDDEPHQPG